MNDGGGGYEMEEEMTKKEMEKEREKKMQREGESLLSH